MGGKRRMGHRRAFVIAVVAWWYNTQPDTYVSVQKGAAVVGTKSSNAGTIVAVVIAVIVGLAIIVPLVLRTRSSGTAANSRGCGLRA